MVKFKPFASEITNQILDRTGMRSNERLNLCMDLAAVNAHTPLDPERLLAFGDGDFWHDIYGIQAHIDRKTGELQDYFLPRCAKHD